MTLEILQNEMYAAMKNKDKVRKETLSSIINTAKNIAIANKDKDNVSEAIVDDAIRKELKTVKEQIETCPADRTENLEVFKTKLSIIESFMPKQMTEKEIKQFILDNFSDVLATKNKGLVMKNVMPQLKGKADGKLINEVISSMI